MTISQQPPGKPPPLEYAAPPARWTTGTLVYTAGGLVALFCWLLWGDFAWSLKERAIWPAFQLLLRKFQASDFQVSLFMVLLPQAITLLIAPVISYKSDRHRGRWGRRIPYLLATTPIMVAAMVLLAFSPDIGAWLHAQLGRLSPGINQARLAVLVFVWTFFEIASIAANSVFVALANDVVPRKLLGRFFALFRAVGLLASIGFNYALMGQLDRHYVLIFLAIGGLFAAGFTAMCLLVKEGDYPPPAPARGPLSATAEYVSQCFGKSYYYWVFAAVVLPNLAFMPINTYNLYFRDAVGMSLDTYGKLMSLYFACSLVLTFPLGWLADKIHPLRLALVALVLHAGVALWGSLMAWDTHSFGIAFVLTGALSGMWYTVTMALLPLLLPRSKFAQYASAAAVVGCLCNMVAAPVIGKILDLSGHCYNLTYLLGFYIDAAAFVATLVLLRRFVQLGGKKHYVAPE